MDDGGWLFDTNVAWSATVYGVPRGDRAADWYETAVPQIAAAGKGRARSPCVVVARVTTSRRVAALGRAKRLLDALHDQRQTGPSYSDCGGVPPLDDDKPRDVHGLAVEIRTGDKGGVEYRLGEGLLIKGARVGKAIDVPISCPNDIGGTSDEKGLYRDAARRAYECDPRPGSASDLALVIRHQPGRDEDNTWEGWVGALAGLGGPLAGRAMTAVASVMDRALECPVSYAVYASGDERTTIGSAKPQSSGPARKTPVERQEGDFWRIETMEQFVGVRKSGQGRIVITDNANPWKIHEPTCYTINEDTFSEKVLEPTESGRAPNGAYFWARNTRVAEAETGATPCAKCYG